MSEAKLIQGRYKPLKKLHRTGLGEVFLVQDVTLDRPLLLETIQGPPFAADGQKLPGDAARQLKGDLEALLALQDPRVLGVIDLQLGGRPPFMVFEPVPGENLVKWRGANPPRGQALEDELESVAHQLVEGLAALHGAGMTHKDLRPATVVRRENGEVTMLEPGLALAGDALGVLDPGYLTPLLPFLAPEVLKGQAPGPASDLYQLGAVLRFLATGKPPHASPDEARAAAAEGRAPPPLKQECPGLRDAWCQFIDELMSPDIATRISSTPAAQEFLDLMMMEEAAQEGLLPGAGPAPIAPPPENPRSRALVLVPAVLITLLAVGAGGYLATAGATPTLKGHFETGIETLRARWVAPEGVRLDGGAVLEIDGEPRDLEPAGDAYALEVPWADVDGKVYTLKDGSGGLLASGTFPEGARDFEAKVSAVYPDEGPLGATEFLVEASHDVRLEVTWKAGGEAGKATSEGDPARSVSATLTPGLEDDFQELAFRVTSPLGETRVVTGPKALPGVVPFVKGAARKLRDLLPSKFVKEVLRPAVKQAADQAITVEFPGWEEIRKKWLEDPDLVRLRRMGPRLFTHPKIDPGLLGNLYDALLGIERANTVVVGLSDLAPIEVRRLAAGYCNALDGVEIRGNLALSSGQGAMMMQYSNPPPSFINEDGKKSWPSSFEAPFMVPKELLAPGKSVRFTVAVEDISPLYRLELTVVFPQEKTGDDDDGGMFGFSADPSKSYWFYPRRNIFDVLEARGKEGGDMLEASHKMAIEIPSSHLEQPNVKLRLRADKLGIWGGHGATTLVGLFVGEGDLVTGASP